MRTFLLLLKNSLFSGYYTNQKKKNSKQANPFNSILILAVVFLVLSSIYNYMYMSMFNVLGLVNDYLILVLGVSGVLTFVLTIFRINQTIYHTKDYEFLESLPITKTKIVASKIVGLYVFDLATTLVIVLPAVVIAMGLGHSIGYCLMILIYSLFVSFIPLALAVFIGFIITLLTAKLKFRNLFVVILYFVFFIGIFVSCFFMGYSSVDISNEQALQITSAISKINPTIVLITKSLTGEVLYGVLFILSSIVAIGLAILVVGLTYHRINNWLTSSKEHSKYVLGKQKSEKNARSAFVKKEILTLVKNPMNLVGYLFVPIVGGIMMVSLPNFMKEEPDMIYFGYAFGIIMCAYMVGITNYSLGAISLEGKSMNFLKSLPLSVNEIVGIKLLVGICISLVPTLIASILFCIILRPEFYIMIAAFLVPTFSILFVAFLGMLLGLKYPVFNWDNPTVALKNSKGAMICTFSSLGLQLIVMIVGVASSILIKPNYMFILFIALILYYAVLALIFGLVLKKSYKCLFRSINGL